MKHKILKFSTVILLFAFIGASCQKDEIEISDESIIVVNEPSINIYKTKDNYRNKLTIGLDSEGNISSTPLFGNDPNIVKKNDNGEYLLVRRYFLKSGYICEDIALDDAFIDITITEMVESVEKNSPNYWTTEMYENRVIDKDPFVEFYFLDGLNKREKKFTLGELNKMIEEGTLETVFEKLK